MQSARELIQEPIMPTIADKRRTFRKLHDTGCFVIPNPWDIGSARYLAHLGFKALATTSAGFAFTRALPDGGVPRDMMLAHIREIVEATDLPVNADFEAGYAHDPAGVAESVRLGAETGVAGLSIEDATGDGGEPLYDLDTAVERMRSARAAIDKAGADVLLVGRCECFLVGKPDIVETVARLKAYSAAGADCLYAPGIRTGEEVAAVVEAAAPKPVNVIRAAAPGLSVAELATLGVRRISVGSAMARAAWGAFMKASQEILTDGRFDTFAGATPNAELNKLFRAR
jgi:2-methylisocitrate lyase-like PEP mutase family enzyme